MRRAPGVTAAPLECPHPGFQDRISARRGRAHFPSSQLLAAHESAQARPSRQPRPWHCAKGSASEASSRTHWPAPLPARPRLLKATTSGNAQTCSGQRGHCISAILGLAFSASTRDKISPSPQRPQKGEHQRYCRLAARLDEFLFSSSPVPRNLPSLKYPQAAIPMRPDALFA